MKTLERRLPRLHSRPDTIRAPAPIGLRLALLHRMVQLFVHLLWRIRIHGREHLPSGPALIVANHVSFADALVLAAALPRPARFLMHRAYWDHPILGRLARWCGARPISAEDGPRALVRSLGEAAELARQGEIVCLFAEGAIARDGSLAPFQRGLERIARSADVAIIPVALAGLERGWFGFSGGAAFQKRPRPRSRVDVRFGAPMASSSSCRAVEARVRELLVEDAVERAADWPMLPELVLANVRRHGNRLAVQDSGGSRATRRQLAALSLCLSRRLAGRGGERVGVLLPPSTAAAVVFVALALGGCCAVPINPSWSEVEQARALARAGCGRLVSSRRFLAALERRSPLDAWAGRTLWVEDLLAEIGRRERVRGWLRSFLPARWLARRARATDEALVLFSSGTTAEPKAVVLTHAALAANARNLLSALPLSSQDILLGVLPLFHAFGVSVSLWTALAAGAGVAFHANPLDARGVAAWIERSRATILCGTPTLYRAWLRRAQPTELASVRLSVAGAEPLSSELAREWSQRFGHELIEGYGATELAPVAALERRAGGGLVVLPGVAVRIADPVSGVELEAGRTGMLIVRGANLMREYLGDPAATERALRSGWYSTGDLGRLEPDGVLVIEGRLSRFSKVGGEMISHVRIELELARCTQAACAVVAFTDADKGERLVVVHEELEESCGALAKKLRASGLPNLGLPRERDFVLVASLPRTALGKADLRACRVLAEEGLRAQA